MREPRQIKLIAALGAAKDLRQHTRLAQLAEQACFDAVLVDDLDLEPTAVLAALATATDRIGLIAGTTTTYTEPYNIARRFLSVDHLSEGRAGWLLHPSGREGEARHYGFEVEVDRVARAAEFYDVVAGLWDSWEDDALLRDKVSGDYMDRDKVHFLDHVGAHFKVRGPLNITRSVQGWPVVAQAPASAAACALAARSADVVFAAPATLAEAQAFYADLKARAAQCGRAAAQIKIMPAIPAAVLSGTPASVADELETWFTRGAADGFLVAPSDDVMQRVIPELQRRGVFRAAYTGHTLRQHLDLPVPANRYTTQRASGGATSARG